MRVLHVVPVLSARWGGPIPFILEGGEAAHAFGISSTVFSTDMGRAPAFRRGREMLEEEAPRTTNVSIELFAARQPTRFAYSPDMRDALRRGAADHDIVHIHTLWLYPQYAAQRAARHSHTPYIVSPHGALDPYLDVKGRRRKWLTNRLWQRSMLEHAAGLHVTTTEEAELIADYAPQVPRHVVPVGVDYARFADVGDGPRFRSRHLPGLAKDVRVVLFLGRLTYKKGVDVLIRSFAESTRRSAAASVLVLVGPDDEKLADGLRAIATECEVADRVVITGPLYGEDRADALAAADLWTLSSHTENFGVAVMEALAAGIPVIVSPAVNLAGAIERDDAGLVASMEPPAFGSAIAAVLDDESLAVRLRENGKCLARRYDWSRVAPDLAEMYRSVQAAH